MRITKATPYLCFPGSRKNWLFVKIETDEGITGWGECYTHLDRDRNIFTIVEELSRYLVDRDPFKIKSFTYFAYVDFAKKRGSLDFFAAVSGIEMALWDIVGKALNTPVYKLLGGAMHDKLRLYANGWFYKSASSEEVAEQAQKMVERGFTGLKIDPLPDAWNMFLSPEEEQYAIDRIKAIREAVGPKVDLMMDCHRRLSAYDALHLAERIEEYNLYWYEEPVSSKNLPLLAETKNKVKMRVVTGEELYTKAEFRQCFESHCTDTINPDLCNCGGILELKEIAAMAEIYYVTPDFERRLTMLQRKPRARYRINHISWWAQELPSDEEYAEARRNLDAVGWQVDYIITHCAPTSIALMGSRHNEADRLTDFLQEVRERAKYHYWLFGHYHDNKAIDEKHILLWEQIVRII